LSNDDEKTPLPIDNGANKVSARAALSLDATADARRLRRKHSAYYRENPQAFRDLVRRAHSRVLRSKPGPKPERDPGVAKAARKRGRGTPFPELYPEFILNYEKLTDHTRGYAEEGFRRKVNEYLRKHPRLRKRTRVPEENPGNHSSTDS